jgi:sugar phosphate isomerase/epimerase
MNFKDRIGVDLGQRNKIEDGLAAAVAHGIRYLDLKIDVAPNAIPDARAHPRHSRGLRCPWHSCRHPHHVGGQCRRGGAACARRVDRYLFGHLEACSKLGGEWMVVHAGYHFTSDVKMRMEAGLERLKRLSARAEELGVTLLLENMNWEPDDAEVHYLAHNVEETLYYFERLDSPRLRWAFTANHDHLVEEGVDGFLANMDIKRCDEVRLADCWRNGKEIHLRPGEGDFDFPDLFRKLEAAGFTGHYMNAFGSLDDMIEGRDVLARMVEPVN